jgi:hypothetical protein
MLKRLVVGAGDIDSATDVAEILRLHGTPSPSTTSRSPQVRRRGDRRPEEPWKQITVNIPSPPPLVGPAARMATDLADTGASSRIALTRLFAIRHTGGRQAWCLWFFRPFRKNTDTNFERIVQSGWFYLSPLRCRQHSWTRRATFIRMRPCLRTYAGGNPPSRCRKERHHAGFHRFPESPSRCRVPITFENMVVLSWSPSQTQTTRAVEWDQTCVEPAVTTNQFAVPSTMTSRSRTRPLR